MSELLDFVKENIKKIVFIIIVVLFLLVLINIKDINFNNTKPESKLVQEVTIETFDMNNTEDILTNLTNSSDIFCKSYLGNSSDLEKGCNELTKSNCADVKCCIYANNKCMSGDINGPTYKTDKDGKMITIDSYYYLGKRQGAK
jgi:hypothetical protein